jgi:hypothetical protein
VEIMPRKEMAMSRDWYLAHATIDQEWVRQLELQWENHYDIEILNPFWDIEREAEYMRAILNGYAESYGQDTSVVVERNRIGVLTCAKTLAIVTGNFTVGTIGEMAFGHSIGKEVVTIALNGHHKNYWIRELSSEVYVAVEEFEQMELQ